MENNHIHSLERIGNSVLMRGESDYPWVYISSANEDELALVMDRLVDDKRFAVIEDWMLPLLTRGKTIAWQLSTIKLILPQSVELAPVLGHSIAPLSISNAQYLHTHSDYQSVTSPAYIRGRIRQGPSAGISVAGKLAAWVMTHDDGAIGFLHVLEAHRRKGYAYALTVYLCQELRAQGKMPYVHIEETNVNSMNLATKAGFVKDRRVHWLEIHR